MKYRMAHVGLFIALLALLCVTVSRAVPFEPDGTSPRKQGAAEQAMAYLRAGQPGPAIELLKKALAKAPSSARLHYHLGLAYGADNKPDLAEAQFRTVLQEDPDYVDAHLRIADLLRRKVTRAETKAKNLKTCRAIVKELAQAVAKSPKRVDLYYHLVAAHLRCVSFRETGAEADFAAAAKLLEAVKGMEPKEVKPHFALGNLYAGQARFAASGKKFSELKPDGARKVAALFAKAETNYRKTLEIDPGYLDALARIAAIRNQQGDIKKAVKVFEDHIAKLDDAAKKAVCYRQMGLYLIEAKDLGGAEAKLNKAIATNSKDLGSYVLLARVLNTRKLPDDAAKMLLTATKVSPTFLNAYVELGQLAMSRKNFMNAERYFSLALSIPPRKAVALSISTMPAANVLHNLYITAALRLGGILGAQARFDEAITVFRRLGSIIPNSPVPEFQIGEILRRAGKLKEARERYANALRRNRGYVRAWIAMAEVTATEAGTAVTNKERARILGQAVKQYEIALKLQPNNASMRARIGSLRVRLAGLSNPKDRAELERALIDTQTAVKLNPDSNAYRAQLANIQHELGHKKEAVAELNTLIGNIAKVVERNPETTAAVFRLAELRALLHTWQPNKAALKQALDGFAFVVKKDPTFLSAYYRAAKALNNEKNYQGAAEWHKKLLEASMGKKRRDELSNAQASGALQASAELAWLYCEYLNDLKQAAAYAEIALKFDPNLPALLDTQGWIHYKSGAFGKAIPPLRRALKGMPNNATIGYHLGATLVKLKNHSRARDVLKHARENVRDDKELKAKIEKLLKVVGN